MPEIVGAKEAMEQLYREYHTVIVSSRPSDTQRDTLAWLKTRFKFHEVINTRETGKNIPGLDVLIDDNLENVKSFALFGGYAILFSQPWNRKHDEEVKKLIKDGKIIPCKDWNGVIEQLRKIPPSLRGTLTTS